MKYRMKSLGSTRYRIRLNGHLDDKWSERLYPMTISTEGNDTILAGEISDQASLHGLLIRIRDLNLKLIGLEISFGIS